MNSIFFLPLLATMVLDPSFSHSPSSRPLILPLLFLMPTRVSFALGPSFPLFLLHLSPVILRPSFFILDYQPSPSNLSILHASSLILHPPSPFHPPYRPSSFPRFLLKYAACFFFVVEQRGSTKSGSSQCTSTCSCRRGMPWARSGPRRSRTGSRCVGETRARGRGMGVPRFRRLVSGRNGLHTLYDATSHAMCRLRAGRGQGMCRACVILLSKQQWLNTRHMLRHTRGTRCSRTGTYCPVECSACNVRIIPRIHSFCKITVQITWL